MSKRKGGKKLYSKKLHNFRLGPNRTIFQILFQKLCVQKDYYIPLVWSSGPFLRLLTWLRLFPTKKSHDDEESYFSFSQIHLIQSLSIAMMHIFGKLSTHSILYKRLFINSKTNLKNFCYIFLHKLLKKKTLKKLVSQYCCHRFRKRQLDGLRELGRVGSNLSICCYSKITLILKSNPNQSS
jgi:hypothetical protein